MTGGATSRVFRGRGSREVNTARHCEGSARPSGHCTPSPAAPARHTQRRPAPAGIAEWSMSHLTWDRIWYINSILEQTGKRASGRMRGTRVGGRLRRAGTAMGGLPSGEGDGTALGPGAGPRRSPQEIALGGLTIAKRVRSIMFAEPSRAEPSRAEPSRAEPSRAEPSRAEPSP